MSQVGAELRYHGAFTPSSGIKYLRSTSASLYRRKPWPFSWTAAVAQHFLMSAAARTLSLVDLCDLSEDAAHKMLCTMRWPDTDGAPICPNCSCAAVYTYRSRRLFKCKACHRQFSVTSGTSLAYRKLPFRTLLMAFSLFVNAAKGISSLQLSRYLGLHAKTAFVLLHKLRCALTSNVAATCLSGVVEIDGGWFGGHVRPENRRVARIDRRRRQHQSGKRRCVVVMRQRGGLTVTAVVKHEAEAVPIIRRHVATGSTVHADEARAWDDLHAIFDMKRINHREAYSKDGACTNQAESYISRLRRAEIGQHHHIAGPHLGRYAGEMAWRDDMRRDATGTQFNACGRLALGHPPSRAWAGYWQRHHRREELRHAA
jgi:transposase-like protein